MVHFPYRLVVALISLAFFSSIAASGAERAGASVPTPVQESSDGARRIKPEEVRELLEKHKAVLVDVRGEGSYKAGHVKGALNIPFSEIRTRAKELPPDKMIITYCS